MNRASSHKVGRNTKEYGVGGKLHDVRFKEALAFVRLKGRNDRSEKRGAREIPTRCLWRNILRWRYALQIVK